MPQALAKEFSVWICGTGDVPVGEFSRLSECDAALTRGETLKASICFRF